MTASTTPAVLDVHDLSLSAAGRSLVAHLGFSVLPGERWCVIGRNAAGKSTLLRALAGLAVPQRSGTVTLSGGTSVLGDSAGAAWLRAYLPQQPNDRFDLTVREWLALHQRPGSVQEPSLERLTASLDVVHLLDRPVTQLSGGERQRVGLAAVAAQDAAVWLLDEPVSFQDPAHQRTLSHWLRVQRQRAIVMSAHDMGWVQHCATHVIALQGTGAWCAGPVAQQLSTATLQATFDCQWHCVQGLWLPVD